MNVKVPTILACILWGSAFAAAKIGFEYMEPMRLSGVRFTLAGLMLFPILFFKKISLKETFIHWKFILFFAFLQSFLQYGLFFMGLNKVPAATSAVIVGAGPLFIAIMAHLFMKNDQITPRKILSILLGLSGVIFISVTKGDFNGSGKEFYIGIALLIVSNIIGGSTNIFVAKYKGNINPIALTAFANLFGGLLLFVCSLFAEENKNMGYPTNFWLALIWLAFIPAAGFSIWYTQLQKPNVKVSELNMWKFVIPITGAILSWILLPNETPNVYSVSGIVIITAAILLFQLPKKKREKRL
ncbi:MAG: DMT family transporter [Paludibacteraceae bacterium]|nr:DMT family transporter [Paludibacteraceae bacterium]